MFHFSIENNIILLICKGRHNSKRILNTLNELINFELSLSKSKDRDLLPNGIALLFSLMDSINLFKINP
mgnify:FL=1